MRYIKLFESYDFGKEEEVSEYFKENIPYLIDKGFSIYSAEYRKFTTTGTKKLEITLTKTDGNSFSWEEVKYDFIPLLEVVSKKYKLSTTTSSLKKKLLFIGSSNTFISYDEIINDEIGDSVIIYKIKTYIEI